MPQPFNNAIMTNVGARLLTKAQAGEIKIEFIRVEVGNGNYTEDEKTLEALQSQTALKSMKNSYPISDIEVYNDYSVKVTALISNQDSVTGDALITAGYYINEMGLYAKEKDGTDDTEVLYSIAVTAGDNGDFMPPYNGYNPAQIIQDYFATVNNSAEITIQTSGAVALAEDLFEVRKDIELLKRNGAANGYSTETEYHAGEYCIYNNTLYRCLKDTSGEWDPESWEMTNPMEEIGQLKKSIDSLIGLFGRDEEGNMKSLGEAAFAGISHNFLTEEDAGMVAGADLLKLLKEQVDSQNSASEGINVDIIKSGACTLILQGRLACLQLKVCNVTENGIIDLSFIPDKYIQTVIEPNLSMVVITVSGNRCFGYVCPSASKQFSVYYYPVIPGGGPAPKGATVYGTVIWFF